jgi:hypothetical protein
MVLLGNRMACKTDLQAWVAELVYYEPMRVPGELLTPTTDPVPCQYTQNNLMYRQFSFYKNSQCCDILLLQKYITKFTSTDRPLIIIGICSSKIPTKQKWICAIANRNKWIHAQLVCLILCSGAHHVHDFAVRLTTLQYKVYSNMEMLHK